MSNTPLYDALRKKAGENCLRMHMPGHKGKTPPGMEDVFSIDYTELPDTGSLYDGEGPIAEAEALMAEAAGAGGCVFLAGGSSQGVKAALSYFLKPGETAVFQRDLHGSAVDAIALLDIRPRFITPPVIEPFGVGGRLDPRELDELLYRKKVAIVYITSPNYYGVVQDIPAISAVCNAHGTGLIVDEAHGAHFPFIGMKSAVELGADISICSAHKTMPALGMGAMTYCSGKVDINILRRKAAMFGSSSPSYAVMCSIDIARANLQDSGRYKKTAECVAGLKKRINATLPFTALDGELTDPTRLTVCTAAGGVSGFEVSDILGRYGIELEMADSRNIVAIFTQADGGTEAERVYKALAGIEPRAPIPPAALPADNPKRIMTVRKAVFSDWELVELERAQGRTAAMSIAPYPPGIPVILPGEEITQKHLSYLLQTSYNKRVYVVAR